MTMSTGRPPSTLDQPGALHFLPLLSLVYQMDEDEEALGNSAKGFLLKSHYGREHALKPKTLRELQCGHPPSESSPRQMRVGWNARKCAFHLNKTVTLLLKGIAQADC